MYFVENCRIMVSMKIILDEIMKKRKLSNRQVAYMTGISKTTIDAVRKGRTPKMTTLQQIAKGLELRIEDLYIDDGK